MCATPNSNFCGIPINTEVDGETFENHISVKKSFRHSIE